MPSRCIVRGDSRCADIAAASILAKVSRDRYMLNLAEKYPQYHFEKHKGYGTKLHYEALREYGPSPEHRPSFLEENALMERRSLVLGARSAAKYLRSKGYTILERNFCCRAGEIDITRAAASLPLLR